MNRGGGDIVCGAGGYAPAAMVYNNLSSNSERSIYHQNDTKHICYSYSDDALNEMYFYTDVRGTSTE